jgi:hypothetical protein
LLYKDVMYVVHLKYKNNAIPLWQYIFCIYPFFYFNNWNNINGKFLASPCPQYVLLGRKLVFLSLAGRPPNTFLFPLNGLSWSYMSMSVITLNSHCYTSFAPKVSVAAWKLYQISSSDLYSKSWNSNWEGCSPDYRDFLQICIVKFCTNLSYTRCVAYVLEITCMHCITAFRSVTDPMYDSGLIKLQYYHIIL